MIDTKKIVMFTANAIIRSLLDEPILIFKNGIRNSSQIVVYGTEMIHPVKPDGNLPSGYIM